MRSESQTQRPWRRRYPRRAKFRSDCSVCGETIAVGQEIAYKPGTKAQHWACYMKGQTGEQIHDPGPNGNRLYASKWFAGAGSRRFSQRSKREREAIARAQQRRHSRLDRQTETGGD